MAETGDMPSQETQQQQQEGECARKRKQKFSELEALIQEMVPNHELLFGKKSLKVPETRKRRISAEIQQKVNAVGVTHRSVDELRKRWYDLSQLSKEKLAARLEQSRHTGGGTSTVSDSTPLEELVEGTLQPEIMMGMADQDSSDQRASGPAPSTTQPTGSGTLNDRPNLGDAGHEEHTDGEDSPVIPQKKQRRNIVRPLPPMECEAENSDENVLFETTQPQQEVRARDHQVPQGTARCRRRTTSNNEDRGGKEGAHHWISPARAHPTFALQESLLESVAHFETPTTQVRLT
ncbi:uncharacterized protein LOC144755859 isoform X2 [Lissotriton helveticus]